MATSASDLIRRELGTDSVTKFFLSQSSQSHRSQTNAPIKTFWQWSIRPISLSLMSQVNLNAKINRLLSNNFERQVLPGIVNMVSKNKEKTENKVIQENNQAPKEDEKIIQETPVPCLSVSVYQPENTAIFSECAETSTHHNKNEVQCPEINSEAKADEADSSIKEIFKPQVVTLSLGQSGIITGKRHGGKITRSTTKRSDKKNANKSSQQRAFAVITKPEMGDLSQKTINPPTETKIPRFYFPKKERGKASRHSGLLQQAFFSFPPVAMKAMNESYLNDVWKPRRFSSKRYFKLTPREDVIQRVKYNETFQTEAKIRSFFPAHANSPASDIYEESEKESDMNEDEMGLAQSVSPLLDSYFESFADITGEISREEVQIGRKMTIVEVKTSESSEPKSPLKLRKPRRLPLVKRTSESSETSQSKPRIQPLRRKTKPTIMVRKPVDSPRSSSEEEESEKSKLPEDVNFMDALMKIGNRNNSSRRNTLRRRSSISEKKSSTGRIATEEERRKIMNMNKSVLDTKMSAVRYRVMGDKIYDPSREYDFQGMVKLPGHELDDDTANDLFFTRDHRYLASSYIRNLNEIMQLKTPPDSPEED